MGQRGSAAVAVVLIVAGVIVMFMVPLTNMAKEKEETTRMLAQQAVSDTLNEIQKKGKITQDDIDDLQAKLNATGTVYTASFTVSQEDENPSKKNTGTSVTSKGDARVLFFSAQIEDQIAVTGSWELKDGDLVSIEADEIGESLYQQIVGAIMNAFKNEKAKITASGRIAK